MKQRLGTVSSLVACVGSIILMGACDAPSGDESVDESSQELRRRLPTAKAGPDQTVQPGATVTLDGTASSGAVSYRWRQTAGATVTLASADVAKTTFVAPLGPASLQFSLTVTNSRGSSTDTVSVSVAGACTKTTCTAQGKNCGGIPDGCGGTLTCGSCSAPETCGGSGVANVCGGAPVPPPSGGGETVGPTAPVGPVAAECSGVNLTPGMSIQTAVNGNPTGTVFCLAAGTYTKQHVVPKAGNEFIGAVGAILDGQSQTVRAFDGTAANVVIQNLVIQNYTAGYQDAPVFLVDGSGWKVLHNEIRNNAGVGILFKDNVLVQFNNIHHNLEMGYGSDGGVGIVFDSNEVAFNNYTDAFDCDECGGGKIWATEGAQMTHNYSHDNHGPGMWDDYNNNDIVYAWNRIENNTDHGIHHEIGYNASIHDNVIVGNGTWNQSPYGHQCGWLWCAAVSIAASGGVNGGLVEVYNNTITPGVYGNAVSLVQQDRFAGPGSSEKYGPWIVQNVWVHDNVIDLSKNGNNGAVQDNGDNAIFTSRSNRFDRNTYKLGARSYTLWWNNNDGGKTFWQGFGLDLNGVFTP